MPFRCSIGVVTYLNRFDSYFKNLIKRLSRLFPDFDITVFINGHHDTVSQIKYLRDIMAFLSDYPQIRYVTHLDHQPLARGWNWLTFLAYHPHVLILNDDVYPDMQFRHNLEAITPPQPIFTLNSSWSHFVIHKDVLRTVGWFDERFQGIGWEDGDMICRCALYGVPIGNVSIHGLHNYVAPADNPSFAQLSEITHKKYSQINLSFFEKKWRPSRDMSHRPPGAIEIQYHDDGWLVHPDTQLFPTPGFYPLAVLDMKPGQFRPAPRPFASLVSRILSRGHWFFTRVRRALSDGLKKILGESWPGRWRGTITGK